MKKKKYEKMISHSIESNEYEKKETKNFWQKWKNDLQRIKN